MSRDRYEHGLSAALFDAIAWADCQDAIDSVFDQVLTDPTLRREILEVMDAGYKKHPWEV